MSKNHHQLLLFSLIVLLINFVHSEEILGCGGFIKSHADIDFSRVEIKLLTKQGSLKDTTDCSPSNGYYFLPLYDKGDFILKISPPPGWSFEPEQINIQFDGKTDLCSLGKDVNFVFKGFGITGRVEILGQTQGAKGVKVELKSENNQDVRSTISDANGVFYFTPVIPGKYFIKVSRDTWHFEKTEQIVLVSTGNTELPQKSFIVTGFDVTGSIVSDGNSLTNIGVALFVKKGVKTSFDCKSKAIPSDITLNNENYENKPNCFSDVQKNGNYVFNGVPSGIYLLKPIVQKHIHLHMQPDQIEIEVKKDSIGVSKNFEVTGFSVSGRVLAAPNGWGVANAKIKLNGKEIVTTHTDGSYTLANIKGGTYTIQVTADNVKFNDQTVKISSNEPILPDIIVASFKVCGQVVSEKSYIVAITKQSSTYHTQATTNSGTGEWCTYLPSGRFTAEVLTSAEEKGQGIQFFPIQQNIEVNTSPVSGILFSQLRATVTGQVKCIIDPDTTCSDIAVTILALDSNSKPTGQRFTSALINGAYSFSDILPGLYEVSVPNLNLCWEKSTHTINVKSATETIPIFIHNGYLVSIISSHSTEMHLNLETNNDPKISPYSRDISLIPGLNTFCTSKFGQYNIKLIGCHTYDTNELPRVINIADHAPITINAIKHRTGVRVISNIETDFQLKITRDRESDVNVKMVKESQKINDQHVYRFDFELKPEEKVVLTPYSQIMLFKPIQKDITGAHDCVDVAFSFVATQGLIIDGKIIPNIGGASIILSFPKNHELLPLQTTSNENGEFKFGPLDNSLEYEVTASKESYVFSEYDKQSQTFKAHKLCEIIATIKDENGQKLAGVLLSLSGSESYRKNLVTGDEGTIKFHSLSPSQYYLRAMMKEYKFEPNSKILNVKDGETVNVEMNGKRVAYSVLGTVRTLNGEPFGNTVIETNAEEPCSHHQEESTTEPNGNYRIRGLQPGCEYTLRVKQQIESSGVVAPTATIERTIPTQQRVLIEHEDKRYVNFIAITPIPYIDVVARVTTNHNEHYKSLRIQMYKKGSADSPIYSQRVDTPLNTKGRINPGIMVFLPRIPYDGTTYFVELTTTLSEKNFKYTLPVESFVANRSSVFVELDFILDNRSTENELNQNSISALLLIGIIAIAFFKQELAFEFFNFLWNRFLNAVESALNKSGGGSNSNKTKKDNRYDGSFDENEIDKLAQSINATKKKVVRRT